MSKTVLLGIAYLSGLVGAILLWRFGLPYKDIDRNGHVRLILEQENASEKRQWKLYNRISHIGIVLIGISFFLQFLSLFLEDK